MTIQPSVTLWTILCFIALMLILDRLLFRPLLSFMDRRQEKIDKAQAEKAAALQEREDALRQQEEDRLAAEKQALADAAAALDALEAQNARRLSEQRAENGRRLSALDEALDRESGDILAAVSPKADALATVIAGRLSRDPSVVSREG